MGSTLRSSPAHSGLVFLQGACQQWAAVSTTLGAMRTPVHSPTICRHEGLGTARRHSHPAVVQLSQLDLQDAPRPLSS